MAVCIIPFFSLFLRGLLTLIHFILQSNALYFFFYLLQVFFIKEMERMSIFPSSLWSSPQWWGQGRSVPSHAQTATAQLWSRNCLPLSLWPAARMEVCMLVILTTSAGFCPTDSPSASWSSGLPS